MIQRKIHETILKKNQKEYLSENILEKKIEQHISESLGNSSVRNYKMDPEKIHEKIIEFLKKKIHARIFETERILNWVTILSERTLKLIFFLW